MESFLEHVSEAIMNWTSERSGRTLRGLALTLGVNETTLRRLRDKSNEPSFEAFEALLPILDQELALQYGEKKWPAKVQRIRHTLKQNMIACVRLQEMMIKDQAHFVVINLCAMPKGVSLGYVEDIIGASGVKVLDDLVDKLLAYRDLEGKFHLFQKFFQITSFESLLKQMDAIQKTAQSFEAKWRSVNVETKSFSPAGYAKAREAQQRLIEELERIERIEKYQGDQMFVFGMISGLLKGERNEKDDDAVSGDGVQ